MFVQIHILQSLPPGNLNRDDTGQPKKCLFGGVTRGRISSQCLKRNIRRSPQFTEYLDGGALRSKHLPRLLCEQLAEQPEFSDVEASVLASVLAAQFKSEKSAASETDESADAPASDEDKITGQLVFFTSTFVEQLAAMICQTRTPESVKGKATAKKFYTDFFKSHAKKIAEASEKLTVDIALFGRMTTSPLVVDVEATCQVAHAIGTHETMIEGDYFTAMDDLASGPGAAFLGSGDTVTFFNSTVYYKYMNLDLDSLRDADHLTAEFSVSDAASLVRTFLQAATLNNPTGKQNSFASHGLPELVLVEMSQTKQPISYANAFLQPVRGDNLMAASAEALQEYIESVASAYAPSDTKRVLLKVGSAKDVAFPKTWTSTTKAEELCQVVEASLAGEG